VGIKKGLESREGKGNKGRKRREAAQCAPTISRRLQGRRQDFTLGGAQKLSAEGARI